MPKNVTLAITVVLIFGAGFGLGLVAPHSIFAGPGASNTKSEPPRKASLSVKDGHRMRLMPGEDEASTKVLKRQGVERITLRLVALSGEQAKTCATITHSWKTGPKDEPSEDGELLLLYKRQTDEQIIPSLGFTAQDGAQTFDGNVVKVKGKSLASFSPAAGRALSPKKEHLLEVAFCAEKDGEKQFRTSVKDPASFVTVTETLKTLKDVENWAKKNPKVTLIVLTVSWLPPN